MSRQWGILVSILGTAAGAAWVLLAVVRAVETREPGHWMIVAVAFAAMIGNAIFLAQGLRGEQGAE